MLFSGLMQSPKLTDTSKMQAELSVMCSELFPLPAFFGVPGSSGIKGGVYFRLIDLDQL